MSLHVLDMRLRAVPLAFVAAWPVASHASSSFSEVPVSVLDTTVVTASRVEQPLANVLADVTVIDRHAIERSGFSDVASLLARQPGIQVVRTGGMGSTTSVFLRGGNTQHTAVYIDGVRIDSQSGSGGADWQTISLDAVDHIEILRGPAAAIYGSDAMAGVISIFTKQGEPGVRPYVGVGAGNRGTLTTKAGISGAQGAWDYAVGVRHEQTDGFQSRTTASSNPDDDDYRMNAVNGNVGLRLNDRHHVRASLLSSRTDSGYDTSNIDDRSRRDLRTAGLSWKAQWRDDLSSRLSVTDSRNVYETRTLPSNSSWTKTDVRSYLLDNRWQRGPHTVTAGLERREDELRNKDLDVGKRERAQNALALGYLYQGGTHSMQLNARHDDDSEFGGKTTGSASWGYALGQDWRITAAAGTGFRAPTLYQRFHSVYGSPDLEPEENHNVELGLRWSRGAHQFSAVAYRNRFRNLVQYNSSDRRYESVSRAELQGITLSGQTLWAGVSWTGSLDLQNPRNTETGRQLARRSRQYASLGAEFQWMGWDLGAEIQASGRRFDNAANTVRLGGYTLYNLSASRDIGRDVSLLIRFDNVTDKDYTVASTYATMGRAIYVGLTWAPR